MTKIQFSGTAMQPHRNRYFVILIMTSTVSLYEINCSYTQVYSALSSYEREEQAIYHVEDHLTST